MDLRHVRYFVAVAEEGSFTRAARRLHLAQPALSVQIRRLEEQLQTELFDRSRRAIRLTSAGAIFLEEARQILLRVDQTVDLVRRVGSGTVGNLSVGFVPSAANAALPAIIRRFTTSHPGVTLHLREMAPDDLLRNLHRGRLDVCFLYLPFDDPSLEQEVVSREPFVAALPKRHRLARGRTVDVAALRDEPFILPARHGTPGLHAQVLDICQTAGFAPSAVQESVWLVQTIVGLVAAGVGVAIVPASARALAREGVAYRALEDDADHEVALAASWRRAERSAVLDAFVASLSAAPREPVG